VELDYRRGQRVTKGRGTCRPEHHLTIEGLDREKGRQWLTGETALANAGDRGGKREIHLGSKKGDM